MSKFQDIHPNAQIGKNVKIASFVTIEEDVVIGDNCEIGANVSILNGTRMGDGCRIFPGAIISSIPQDLKFQGENTTLNIGNNVTIREYCTINRGTMANGATVIGNNTLIMAYCHVAHDCVIHENCILSNCVNLAGHIEVGPKAVLGGLTAVHQFVRIGDHVMVGGGSLVRKDVPPYVKAAREPLSYAGVNSIGLRRRGFSKDQINNIRDIYRILYVKGNNTTQALQMIESSISDTPEKSNIIKFIKKADRGIIRGLRSANLVKANGHNS
ncbi:MAG: acyl-ACP--UDP-N-acetylglucosamine O-acyltransferase [Saprospiraceae bacterium]|nr:acyl-ACP--UDP-N-acetylglucosamine O-acyltransferase [Saprospiraceae bacterium]